MQHDKCLDILGNEIEPGDTVVYATYSRDSGLQRGTVVSVLPFATHRVYVPETGRYESAPNWKIKFTTQSRQYVGGNYDLVTTKRTLDNPLRFAVVAKA
jgi:hypothetical protein